MGESEVYKTMNHNGEILNLEDMFSVIRSENILMDLFKKDCPGFTIKHPLPSNDLKTRNSIVHNQLREYRKTSPECYGKLHETMTFLSYINANQTANAFISEIIASKYPEAGAIIKNYRYDLLTGVELAAEKAAVIYCSQDTCEECIRAWLQLRDLAVSYMDQALVFCKWFQVSPITRTHDEIMASKDEFKKVYCDYRRIENPSFDAEVLPTWVDRKLRIVIEMTPPPQPVKTDERDPETGRFSVQNNKNICTVIFEYDAPSEYARITKSKYGSADDKFIIDKLLKLVLGTKIIPTTKRPGHLDIFRTRSYTDKVSIPMENAEMGDEAHVSEIDLSYCEDAVKFPNAPITIHHYAGANIYDQIDRLLPEDKYPVALRTIHKVVVSVSLCHYRDQNGRPIRTGKRDTYKITLTPTSCTTTPNIDNPSKVRDRGHAKIIKDYIKRWGLEGEPVCKKK